MKKIYIYILYIFALQYLCSPVVLLGDGLVSFLTCSVPGTSKQTLLSYKEWPSLKPPYVTTELASTWIYNIYNHWAQVLYCTACFCLTHYLSKSLTVYKSNWFVNAHPEAKRSGLWSVPSWDMNLGLLFAMTGHFLVVVVFVFLAVPAGQTIECRFLMLPCWPPVWSRKLRISLYSVNGPNSPQGGHISIIALLPTSGEASRASNNNY